MSDLDFASIPLDQPLPEVENGYRLFAGEVLNAIIYRLNNGGSVTIPVPVIQGGTGAEDAGDARFNLGLEIGVNVQQYSADLTAIAALADNGLVVRTGSGTYAGRSLAQPAAGMTITNPAGIAGNPTFAFTGNLLALTNLAGTGLAVQTGAGTWAQRSIANGTGISVTNGNGVAGNPSVAIDLTASLTWTGVPRFSNGAMVSDDGLAVGAGGATDALIYQPAVDQLAIAVGAGVFTFTATGITLGGVGYLRLNGGTLTGTLNAAPSALGGAGLNLGQGSTPSAPTNGDVWIESTGLYARYNGATVGPFGTGGGGSGTVTSVNLSGGTTGLTFSGGPITTNGVITAAGTLAIANGGTGITAFGTNIATALGTNLNGTGAFVGTTSPTLVTPVLGTPTSGNLSNCTADGTTLVGFRSIPQNSKSAAYTSVLADSGKCIFHPASDANARTFTIDSNANVAYPVGTVIEFINRSANAVTIAITSDTLTWAPTGGTGSRTLAQYGVATAQKIGSTEWIITGVGLT